MLLPEELYNYFLKSLGFLCALVECSEFTNPIIFELYLSLLYLRYRLPSAIERSERLPSPLVPIIRHIVWTG